MYSTEAERLSTLLGGTAVLGRGETDLTALVRAGIPFKAYNTFVTKFAISSSEQSFLFGIKPRTLTLLRSQKIKLEPLMTDRLVRVARLVGELMELWDDPTRVQTWLRDPNRALAGKTPIQLLDTDPGIRQVENIINRLKYGGFA